MTSNVSKRRIGVRVALGLVSLALSIGIAEFVASLLYQPPLEIPDAHKFVPFARTGRFTPAINELGFRQSPVGSDASAPDVLRILCLGDSFTFGDGIERGEDRFTDLIEARLNADASQHAAGRKFHVYNAGVSGSRPTNWVQYMSRILPTYRPDAVFAVFFLRDGTELCTSLRCFTTTIEDLKARYARKFGYRFSCLARIFYARLIMRDFSEDYRKKVVNSYLGSNRQRATWVKQQVALRDIRDRCRALGVELQLIVFPLLFDLDRYPYESVEQEIARFAREADIPCFSLLEGFRGHNARSLWVAPHDQHPNEKGHRIAADTLYPYLRRAIGLTPN